MNNNYEKLKLWKKKCGHSITYFYILITYKDQKQKGILEKFPRNPVSPQCE